MFPLIPAKAGTQFFGRSKKENLVKGRSQSPFPTKGLGPRFRGDERHF